MRARTGCAIALRGEDANSFGLGADPTALGRLQESFVFCESEKCLPFLNKKWGLSHRRMAPRDVDIVAEAPGRVLAIFEMKASMTFDRALKHGPGHAHRGAAFLMSPGAQVLSFGPDRVAVPLSVFWSYWRDARSS